ncbi:hypothetical protein Lser_V15G02984 [Lactuca serriola]
MDFIISYPTKGLMRNDPLTNSKQNDLELGDAVSAANVSFFQSSLSDIKLFINHLTCKTKGRKIDHWYYRFVDCIHIKYPDCPRFGGKIIDIVSGDLQTSEQNICTTCQAWLFSSAIERIIAALRKNLFTHLVNQEIAFFDVTRTRELLSRLYEDTQITKIAAT